MKTVFEIGPMNNDKKWTCLVLAQKTLRLLKSPYRLHRALGRLLLEMKNGVTW